MDSNDVNHRPKLEKNQALQTPGSRTPIHLTQLHLLKRGDHIGWHRRYVIWHHAIVVDIDIRNRELHVIHYTKVDGEFKIAKQRISVEDQLGDLFRFDCSRNITDVNPPDIVLERAERRIGEINYKLLSKNCEHFATFCKTGREDRTGQTNGYGIPIKGRDICLLKPGDHIGWHRPYGICHHAIVFETDVRNRELLVMHYTKVGGKAVVAKQRINVDDEWGTLFLFDYSENITDEIPTELVLARAESRLGEERYHCLNNNCEHFATFCKTGRNHSHQVQRLREFLTRVTLVDEYNFQFDF